MSKAHSAAAHRALQVQFADKCAMQSSLSDIHEVSGAYGLAYLAHWAVLETFVKQLSITYERAKLQADLLKWAEFMNGASVVRPTELSTAKYKPDTFLNAPLPSRKQLALLITVDQAPTFHLVLDPDQRYRKRRNAIAHSGESVSVKVYEDFKAAVQVAIAEINSWLYLDVITGETSGHIAD